jgi:hypothetical protein
MLRLRRTAALAAGLLTTAMIATAAPAAAQAPPTEAPNIGQPLSREALAERLEAPPQPATEAPDLDAELADPLGSTAVQGTTPTPAKPRNDRIENVPEDPNDASIPLNLIPYHEFAPRLRALQESDRISVEILGQSTQGRDLHMVVVSTMDDDAWAEWQRLSDLRTEDPAGAAAAFAAGEYDDWQVPVMINNNIHGNEWEGTDAAFQLLDELAFSDDEAVTDYLDDHVTIVVISNNPDGRVNATRANAAGFDMNRDFAAQTQPEVRIVRDVIIRYNPVSMLDQHGYVNPTLIEPTTGPHGQNYEMDLYISHALRAAEAMEAAVADLDEPRVPDRIEIPYRDTQDQWDGWPPVYTPMYAMSHGVVGHTVEFPLNPRSSTLTQTERHERTRINTAVSLATMHGNLSYVHDTRDDYLADQIEFYRRGAAGEPTRPIDDPYALEQAACRRNAEGEVVHCNSDTYTPKEFPRAWVLPAGDDQRSATAAVRTAQYLLDNDVVVHEADEAFTLGGETYAAGTFVVDMHQAKRGLANNALEVGRNLSDDWRAMYGDAAWSIGSLYGATLVAVEDASDAELGAAALERIGDAARPGSVPAQADRFGLRVDSLYGIQAVNALLAEGVELSRSADGTFVIPGTARALVEEQAETRGVSFTAPSQTRVRGAVPFDTHTVGVSTFSDEAHALVRMGFDVRPVSHTTFNSGEVTFDDLDALYVSSSTFNPVLLDPLRQAAFAAWLEDGNAVVGRGPAGYSFTQPTLLMPGLVSQNASGGNRDGIAAVVNDAGSPVTGDALDVSFLRNPNWFPNADALSRVRVDQRLGSGDYFLAGHWPGWRDGAEQPVVVSRTSRGAYVTLFGTHPFHRAHPEGLFTQVAEALWMPPAPPVDPIAPTADAGGPYEVELGDEVVLDGSGTVNPDDQDLTYEWDLSELGGGDAVEGETVTVTPEAAGEFEVTLTVTDENDPPLSDQDTTTVTVTDPGTDPEPGDNPACDEVEPRTFPDVRGGPHGDNIGCVAGYGIAQGRADGTYGPLGNVRRDQMASFLVRTLRVAGVEVPDRPRSSFRDVQSGPHAKAIAQLADLGVVEGRGDGRYQPRSTVTRAQMASFLIRSLEVVLDRDLRASGPGPFTDIAGSPHADNIRVASELEIAKGRTATRFVPNDAVRRDQMASFIARSLRVLHAEGVELTPID